MDWKRCAMRRESNIQHILMCDHKKEHDNDLRLQRKIRSIDKKINRLGAIGSKGFDWIEWDSLVEDRACLEVQLSWHRAIVKEVLSRYD